jgi:lysophospholipase L1-like esterase
VAAAETAGSSALVLAGPPVFHPGPVEWNTEIETINPQLRGRIPDVLLEDTIDFSADDMQPDGLHLNPLGHSKRAQRVAEALDSRFP